MSYSQAPSYDENPFSAEVSTPLHSAAAGAAAVSTEPPAWLKEGSTSGVAAMENGTAALSPEAAAAMNDPAVPRMILYTRVINLVLSICMIVASLLSLLTTDNATTGVLACYVVVFSCLLCCFETHLKQIAKLIAFNFGFMYSAKSRSVFMLFIGSILFSFSLFGKIIGCLMLANAGFNIYVLIKYPGYEDAQRRDATAEIKDYLAANPAFAQSMASLSASVATAALSSQMQQQGLESGKQAPPSSFSI